MASTQVFGATGLTCGHCAHAVTEEVSAIPGVETVDVALVVDGTSTVTVSGDAPVSDADVAAALDEAGGYVLVRS